MKSFSNDGLLVPHTVQSPFYPEHCDVKNYTMNDGTYLHVIV
jgi:hypothetical protein